MMFRLVFFHLLDGANFFLAHPTPESDRSSVVFLEMFVKIIVILIRSRRNDLTKITCEALR